VFSVLEVFIFSALFSDIPTLTTNLRPGNHVFPRRSNTNPFDLDTHKLLNIFNISPRLVWQVVPVGNARRRLLPARQGVVVYLDLGKYLGVGWEAIEFLALVRICGRYLDLSKAVEDIELGQVDGGVIVAGVRVLDYNKIEPTAAALAAGCNANFVAYFLELLANLVKLLGGEGSTTRVRRCAFCRGHNNSRSDTGGVGFDDANDFSQ
jgi:hypothetical protein